MKERRCIQCGSCSKKKAVLNWTNKSHKTKFLVRLNNSRSNKELLVNQLKHPIIDYLCRQSNLRIIYWALVNLIIYRAAIGFSLEDPNLGSHHGSDVREKQMPNQNPVESRDIFCRKSDATF